MNKYFFQDLFMAIGGLLALLGLTYAISQTIKGLD